MFAFRLVERLREDDVVAELESLFFNRHDDAGDDGVRDGRDDQAEEFGGLVPKSLRDGVWRVAHLLGERANAELGGGGDV